MELQEFQDLTNNYKNIDDRKKLKDFLTSPQIFPNKRTLVFSTPSETGTSYFRLLEPAFSIIRNFPDEFNIIYTENVLPPHFNVADLIVMHRADQRHTKLIKVGKAWPQTKKRPLVIHDVDDNEFNIAHNHSMREMWLAFGKDKHSLYAIRNSDHITTTGKGLYDTFKQYNPNVTIFPNMFNWRLPQWNLWDKQKEYKEKYKDKIVIGYCGLSSHQDDLKKLIKSWKIIHDKYPNTYFIISGVVTTDVLYNLKRDENGTVSAEEVEITDPNQTYKGRVLKMMKDFDPSRYELQDNKNLEDFGEFYTQYDINCVFVEHNTFNKCKSPIKMIEGLRYNSIPLVSNWGPYHDIIEALPSNLKNLHISCNIENEKFWADKLSYIIENIEEMKKYSEELGKYICDLYDIDLHIEDRVNFYKKLMDEHQEKEFVKTTKWEFA